jgi:hypothetical protein
MATQYNTTTHPYHLDNTATTNTPRPHHRSAARHVFRPALLHRSRSRRHRNSARAKHPRADQQSATGLLTPPPPTELHPLFQTPPTISIPRPARAEPTLSLLPRTRFLSCTNCFDSITGTSTRDQRPYRVVIYEQAQYGSLHARTTTISSAEPHLPSVL